MIFGSTVSVLNAIKKDSLACVNLYDIHAIMSIINKIYKSKLKKDEDLIHHESSEGLQYHVNGTLYFGKYSLTGNFING